MRFRSGSTISARAGQGMTWASWINGCGGETSMVTGCTLHGVSSPEKLMLMGMPSRLHVFLMLAGDHEGIIFPEQFQPLTWWLVSIPISRQRLDKSSREYERLGNYGTVTDLVA